MDNKNQPVGPDDGGRVIVEMSGLRDGIETLDRTIRGTAGAGVVITAIFMVGAMFMEQSATLLFLAALWSAFTLRLVLINRRSVREKQLQEAALESLAHSRQELSLPTETADDR